MAARAGWRPILAASALALGVRAAVFIAASILHPGSFMVPDSSEYDRLGRTLLHHGRFAEGPARPANTRRTPGFPLLIAGVYAAAGEDPRAVIWAGIALSVLTVTAAAWIAGRRWGRRAAWTAGLLLALDPPSVTASRLFLTETSFTAPLLAAAGAAMSLLAAGPPRWWRGALLGALLAAAALTRPIGLLLVMPGGLWLVFAGRTLRWDPRAIVSLLGAFALPWILAVGGWQLRNRAAAGALVASDGPAKYLYFSRGADILAQRDRVSIEVARARLTQSMEDEVQRTGRPAERLYAGAGLALAARHPVLFAKTSVRWLPELLLGTGAAAMVSDLDLDGPDRPRARIGARWLGACAAAQLLLLYAGAGWGLGRLWDEPGAGRLTAVLLAGLALYFVILSTGPQAYSRFRVPISPLLALAAARGLARPSGDGQ